MDDYSVNDPLGGDIPLGNFGNVANDPLGGDIPLTVGPDVANDPFGGDNPVRVDESTLGDPTAVAGGMPNEAARDSAAGGGDVIRNFLRSMLVNSDGSINLGGLAGAAGLLSLLNRSAGSGTPPAVGYQGKIPTYKAVRERVPVAADVNRRPGAGGRRYFSDTAYVPQASGGGADNAAAVNAVRELAKQQARQLKQPAYPEPRAFTGTGPVQQSQAAQTQSMGGLPAIPRYDEQGRVVVDRMGPFPNVITAAQGGLMNLAKGRYLNGSTDGMADKIPANIEGTQPAALSHGEFVIPADVVSHLGNGNSEAGAQRLYDMMDRIRKARTGTTKQGKQINPNKLMPK
jgi:hypothetical protein